MNLDNDILMKSLGKMKAHEKEVTSGGGGTNLFSTEKFWKPEVPKKGKNTFRIRPLPTLKEDGAHWVLILIHTGIKTTTGGWINEPCPETFPENKGQCPICNESRRLFNTGDPADEKRARLLWRKKSWVANILVVKDGRNDGSNENKVFMYKFGQKVYNKFDNALFPDPESGDKPLIFLNPTKGYDFKLVTKMVKDGQNEFPNYDDSEFYRESTPIDEKDKKIEEILENAFDLESELLAPTNFKTIEELEKILSIQILGSTKPSKPNESNVQNSIEEEDEEEDFEVETESGEEYEEDDSSSDDDDFLSELEKDLDDDD